MAALITFTSEALYDSVYQLVLCVWGLPPDPRRRRLTGVRVSLGMACAAPVSGHGKPSSRSTHWSLFHSSNLHSSYAITTSSAVIIDAKRRLRSISWINNERRRADRVQQSSRIARRQTLAEMRRSVARRLAPFDSPIGFHHRNLTRSPCLGEELDRAGLALLTP